MPSSSGGGFGGGGSFGGGFHSSGHSSGSNSRGTIPFSTIYFLGATRYHYINSKGRECTFYYKGRPSRVKASGIIGLVAILAVMIILSCVIPMLLIPRKLSDSFCIPKDSYYEDNASIINNQDELTASLAAFYDKTGVQPYIYTLKNTSFPSSYGKITPTSLENYAYDLYLSIFKDEGHWLIVFVEYENSSFAWIDMHGDYTDNIINDDFFEDFQNDMQEYLESEPLTHAEAIKLAFDNATTRALKPTFSTVMPIVIFLGVFLVIIVVLVIQIVQSVKQYFLINGYLDYEKAHPNVMSEPEASDLNELNSDPFK